MQRSILINKIVSLDIKKSVVTNMESVKQLIAENIPCLSTQLKEQDLIKLYPFRNGTKMPSKPYSITKVENRSKIKPLYLTYPTPIIWHGPTMGPVKNH